MSWPYLKKNTDKNTVSCNKIQWISSSECHSLIALARYSTFRNSNNRLLFYKTQNLSSYRIEAKTGFIRTDIKLD